MNISRAYILYKVSLYKLSLAILLLCFPILTTSAQDDVEYRYDIGAGVNVNTYYGDFNSSLFRNMQPGGAIVMRKVINPYSAVRFSLMYASLKGGYKDTETVYPELEQDYNFKTSLGDLSATYEYNFWAYGTGKDYRGAKRIAPFISIGFGLTYAKCNNELRDYTALEQISSSKSTFTANIPIGFGVKYRIQDRWNMSIDWQMHFSLSDQLDGVSDPYHISSSGIFKNTDCYSTLTVALTYSFSAKCPTCMKDRW